MCFLDICQVDIVFYSSFCIKMMPLIQKVEEIRPKWG